VTDVMLSDQQMALMKNDLQREFAIEIETDSTIRADLSRTQQNISGFITGLGSVLRVGRAGGAVRLHAARDCGGLGRGLRPHVQAGPRG
jgi:hypothetical protein